MGSTVTVYLLYQGTGLLSRLLATNRRYEMTYYHQAPNAKKQYLKNCRLYANRMADLGVKRSPRNSSQLNWSICLIMLGDSGTGKTSLVKKFVGEGVECNKLVTVEKEHERNGFKISLEIRDTAGMERYRSLTKSHYKGAHGAMLVFDVTNEDSFNHMKHWYDDLKTYSSQDQNIAVLLVGTRCHKTKERTVMDKSARAFAENHDMKYMEVSSEENINVEQSFDHLIDIILEISQPKQEIRFESSLSQESSAKYYLQSCSNCCGTIRQGSETSSNRGDPELAVKK